MCSIADIGQESIEEPQHFSGSALSFKRFKRLKGLVSVPRPVQIKAATTPQALLHWEQELDSAILGKCIHFIMNAGTFADIYSCVSSWFFVSFQFLIPKYL